MSTPSGSAEDGLTVPASPGLLYDADHGVAAKPAPQALATLTIVPRFVAHIADPHPGAEQVDVILTHLLTREFHTLGRYAHSDLSALPIAVGWAVRLNASGDGVSIEGSGEVLYAGDLGAQVPQGWHDTVARAGQLGVLVATGIDLERSGRPGQIDAAARRAGVVAALIRTAGATIPA